MMLPLPVLSLPTKALIVIGLAALLFLGGWEVRGWKEDALRLEEVKAHHAAMNKLMKRNREVMGQVSQQLADERAGREQDRLIFDEELNRVSGQSLVSVACPRTKAGPAPAAPSAPLVAGSPHERAGSASPGEGAAAPAAADPPDVRLTGTYSWLWDNALAIGATDSERAARADAGALGSRMVEPKETLANLAENARRWADCRADIRGWQRFACEHGLASDAQCRR